MKMKADDVRRALVVGAGCSGAQIGLQFARFGIDVDLVDTSTSTLTDCRIRHDQCLQTWLEDGIIQKAEVAAIGNRIRLSSNLETVADAADVVVECVPEDLKTKRTLFQLLGNLCREETIFTTIPLTCSLQTLPWPAAGLTDSRHSIFMCRYGLPTSWISCRPVIHRQPSWKHWSS